MELAREGMLGRFEQHSVGRWKDRFNLQQANANNKFRAFCKRERLHVRLRRWTVSRLSLSKYADRPHWKSKAWPALVNVDLLCDFCTSQAVHSPHNEYIAWRARVLWELKSMFCVFGFGPTWLTASQIQELNAARDVFF